MQQWFSTGWWMDSIYGGTPHDWLTALALSIAIALGVYLIKPILLRRLKAHAERDNLQVDGGFMRAVKATRVWLICVFALSIGSHYLDLPEAHAKALTTLTALAFILQIGFWASAMLGFFVDRSRQRALATDAGSATSLAALSFVGNVILWAIVVLLALDNLGVNITALVAGLGVGGVAVALAVQNILGDLFASLSIIVDKPFVIGDFIIVDSYLGSVEHVGLKTTRIRSLGGEQIVFSNGDLLKTRIRNYKRMVERRVLFSFNLVYETTAEQAEEVPRIVRRIIEAQERVRFDRSHFFAFGEYALSFETVYWVLSPAYNDYMDTQQAINLALMREFKNAGIRFAVPRQTTRFEAPVRVQVEALPGDEPRSTPVA